MESIIVEGVILRDIARKAKENNIPVIFYPSYGGTGETRIIKGVTIQKSKIWFPKKYRTIKSELNFEKLKFMKLKKMMMYNDEEAFFLIE